LIHLSHLSYPSYPQIKTQNSKIENPMNSENPHTDEPAIATGILASGRRRTGHVARLAKAIRDRINQMLLDGVPYADILQRLGDDARSLDEGQIGTWKRGGHQDWLHEQQRIEVMRFRQEFAMDLLAEKDGTKIHQATLQVAAANLVELVVDLDPTTLRQTLEEDPEKYTRLLHAIARLSDGEIRCERHRNQEAERLAKIAKDKAVAEKKGGISPEALTAAVDALNLM
jgi:hypothetical protein